MMRGSIVILLATCLSATFAGGCSSASPGKLSAVKPTSSAPRAGNAYLVRGFIGVFSLGMDDLSTKLNESGVRSHVYQDDQWAALARAIGEQYRSEKFHEPIILIGHSYGADDVIRVARKLQEDNIQVALLVTLDPVTPPRVPGNVATCLNIYQSNGAMDALPWLRGIPLQPDEPGPAKLVNANIRKDRVDLLEPGIDHFNIDKKPKIQQEVVKHVLATCPPRSMWVAQLAAKNAIYAGGQPSAPAEGKPAVNPAVSINADDAEKPSPN